MDPLARFYAPSFDRVSRRLGPVVTCIAVLCALSGGANAQGPSTAQPPEATGHRFVPPPPMPPSVTLPTPAPEAIEESVAPPLDLQTLLDLACRHNPTLRQAKSQVTATLGAAIQAGLYPNPEAAFLAEQIGVEGTPGEFIGAAFRQEIVTAGKLRLSRAKFLERVKVAEAQAVAQQYRVCNDIRIHYFDLLGHRELIAIQKELLKSSEDAALTARELYNVGQANRAVVLQSNVQLQRARLDMTTMENRYHRAVRRLAALVGAELHNARIEGQLDGQSEMIPFDVALARLWENSPELLAAHAKLRGDQYTMARERVQPIPNLHLEGGVGHNYEAKETVAMAGVSVKLPLWDRNQGTIQQAAADLARQRAEIERLRMTLKQRLADTYENYATAFAFVTQYREAILPDLRAAYQTLLESYEEDRTTWPSVLESQKTYFEARAEYTDRLVALRTSEVLINGLLLHGGLQAAEGPTPPGHIDATPQPR